MRSRSGRPRSSGAPSSATTSTERFYHQLYRDPNIDVWLICWLPEQGTGYHDHDRSDGAVYVCRGSLSEDYFCRDEDGWIREKTNLHETGGHFLFEAADIHGVRHAGEGPATSVHVYSPALWRMGHYDPDSRGVLAPCVGDLRRRARSAPAR